jgi:hypothetical protein
LIHEEKFEDTGAGFNHVGVSVTTAMPSVHCVEQAVCSFGIFSIHDARGRSRRQ